MKIKTPHYYENFKCIASECSDSCCAGWEVDLDDEAFERYAAVTGSFGDRLRREMSEVGERHFTIHDKRCPFLNRENLCDIYTEMGEDALCETCTNFPRCYEEYGSTREMALSMACPEVVRLMIESDAHLHFHVTDDHKAVSHYNDIHGELYMVLNRARDCVYRILKAEGCGTAEKLLLLLSLGDELERCMARENCARMAKIIACYEDDVQMQDKCKVLDKKYRKLSKKRHGKRNAAGRSGGVNTVRAYLKLVKGCECVSEKWIKMLEMLDRTLEQSEEALEKDFQNFRQYAESWQREYDYFLENLTYRYFLRGVFDGHIADKTRFLAFMYIFIGSLHMAWWKTNGTVSVRDRMYMMQTLSKEIEHSDENMAVLWDKCTKGKAYFSSAALGETIYTVWR